MADLTGTEKQKRNRKKHQGQRHADVQTTNGKEQQKKENADDYSVVSSQHQKCLGRLQKDMKHINGLFR